MTERESEMSEVATTSAIGDRFPVLGGDAGLFAEVMRENFGSDGVLATDLDRVNIPPQGATNWQVPTLEGEDSAKSIEGIIVAWNGFRTYWEKSLDEQMKEGGDKSPPDCSSSDATIGVGAYGAGSEENPSGSCAECPMNEWGSDGDKGKACKEGRQLYVLRPGSVLPIGVSLPPTSIVPLRRFFLRLAGQGVPYYGVVASLSIEKATSGGFTYGVVKPAVIEVLSPEARQMAREYGESFKKGLKQPALAGATEDGRVG